MSIEGQKTILLVEDEAIIALAEKTVLENFGYGVLIAHSGEEALATVAKTPAIGLILMDINLGAGMDGTDAAALILSQRDLPVVFLSSHTEPKIVAKTEKITSYGYVAKGSGAIVLQASIKMAFKLFEANQDLADANAEFEAANKELIATNKELIEAQKKLRASEEKFQLLVENSHDIIFTLSRDGVFDYVSPAWTAMLGHPLHQVAGQPFQPFVHDDDIAPCMAWLQKMIETGQKQSGIEYRVRHSDGSWRWHSSNAVPLRDEAGAIIGIEGIASDISERKQAEEALKEMNRKFIRAQRIAQIGSWDSYLPTNKLYWSEEMYRIMGFPPNTPINLAEATRVFPPEELERFQQAVSNAMKGNTPYSMDYQIVRLDGSVRYIHDEGEIVHDEHDQAIWMFGTTQDISERKQVEAQREAALDALRMSEKKLHKAQKLAHIGVWDWNVDTDTVTWTDELFKIAGRDPMQPAPTYAEQHALYSRESWQVLNTAVERALATSEPYQLELTMIRPDGGSRYVNAFGGVMQAPDERVKGLYGIVQDITEYKLAEEEIKRQLSEKEILLKEVHHRIKNNIVSIGALISLHIQSISNPEAIAVLQDAIGRVNSMALLYDKLLLTEDYKVIAVKNYIESISETIVAMFADSARIKLDLRIDDLQLEAKRLFPLGLITNELITNKMKHAFIGKDSGTISLSLKKIKNKVTLAIHDNGNGLPAGFKINEAKGFGLILVEMLSQQLAASFSMENRAGTRCKVEFTI